MREWASNNSHKLHRNVVHYRSLAAKSYGSIANMAAMVGVHTENGGEYGAVRNYRTEGETEHSTAPPYSKNQKEIDKEASRTPTRAAHSLHEHVGLPRNFWAETAVRSAEIRNHFLCRRDSTISSIFWS